MVMTKQGFARSLKQMPQVAPRMPKPLLGDQFKKRLEKLEKKKKKYPGTPLQHAQQMIYNSNFNKARVNWNPKIKAQKG